MSPRWNASPIRPSPTHASCRSRRTSTDWPARCDTRRQASRSTRPRPGAARDAWQRSGHRVIGTALAARAAAELEATAGIPGHTIAGLLQELDDPEHGRLPAQTVLIVDEAGMVGTRQLARILDHAAVAH